MNCTVVKGIMLFCLSLISNFLANFNIILELFNINDRQKYISRSQEKIFRSQSSCDMRSYQVKNQILSILPFL